MAPTKPKPPIQVIDTFLTQKDILSALLVWILLEGFSFILLPSFTLITAENKTLTWILISAPMGLIGALMIGFCSSWLQYCQLRIHKTNPHKKFWVALGNVGSWIGLAGIGFPLIMIGLEMWVRIVYGMDA
ncbi:hypothetical protein [Acaryochloris sp. IP29b_bin.148]|uniref:hypothetical protein n=1 Tax=Acaryochloris sp. IP29b_bin.148 TaxID=2969218 RepID=UPI00262B7CF8|nr:hypothetical protein [Acaryochloris sp. IP29b_bin.148]